MIKHIIVFLFVIYLYNFNIYSQIENEPVYYTDSSTYDVSFYGINLEASENSTYLKGYTIIKAKVIGQTLSNFYIELSDTLQIDSIIYNDQKIAFQHSKGWIKAKLPLTINPEVQFLIIVYYHGLAESSNPLGGIGSNTEELYTSSEPFSASDFFPCKQWLTDKADSINMNITVPNGQTVASNGLLKEKLPVDSGKTLFKWETHYPIAYYLIAFTVGNFYEQSYKFYDENYGDSILFQNYLYNDTEFINQNLNIIDKTTDIIKLYERLTGVPYPFRKEKYGHVMAPIGGGMENQTLTSLSEVDFDVVAHELGHSWFGDRVTCSDWQNIWINEGCASYMEYMANEYLMPDAANQWLHNAMKYALNSTGSIYVPDDSKWNDVRLFSNGLSYKKGALLLHMLRNEVNNDSIFFDILKTFLNQYAYSNASANDFKNVANEVTSNGRFDKFFNQWFYGSGYPTININCTVSSDSIFIVLHNPTIASDNTCFHYYLNILTYLNNGNDSTLRIEVNDTLIQYKAVLKSEIESVNVNPDLNLIAVINISPVIYLNTRNILAFPNPFIDSTTLRFYDMNSEFTIDIFDLNGNKIHEWTEVKRELKIEPGLLKPGVYIVRANSGNNIYSAKIIMN